MARVFRFRTNEKKCPGCGYRVVNHYVVEETELAAETYFHEHDRGLCGDCLLDVMIEEDTAVEMV